MYWTYEKLDDQYKVKTCYPNENDYDGSITGHFVYNVHAWFDENPEERKRLGWIKHIKHSDEEIREIVGGWNPQTQNLITTPIQIDDWTVKDTYHVLDKSEEQLLFEEMLDIANPALRYGSIIFY